MAVIGSRRDESYLGPYLRHCGKTLSEKGSCFYCQGPISADQSLVYWFGGGVMTNEVDEEPAEQEWDDAEDGPAEGPGLVGEDFVSPPAHRMVSAGMIVLHARCVMEWFVRLAKDVREIAAAEP